METTKTATWRIDQHVRFVAQGMPLIVSLDTRSTKNEWVIKPENPDETTPDRLAELVRSLARKTTVRIQDHTLIMDAGWDDHHVINDGIMLRPNWDGLTLDGLLSATACLIAHSLSLLVSAFGTCHFRRSDGKKIQYRQFNNWHSVHLMRPDRYLGWYNDDEVSEEDLALIRLYDRLGLTEYDDDLDDDFFDPYLEDQWNDERDWDEFMDEYIEEDEWDDENEARIATSCQK